MQIEKIISSVRSSNKMIYFILCLMCCILMNSLFFLSRCSVAQAQVDDIVAIDRLNRGKEKVKEKDFITASELFKEALDYASETSRCKEEAHFNLVKSLLKLNNESKAIEEVNRLKNRNPNSPALDDLEYLFGTYYLEKGKWEQAVVHFNNLKTNFPASEYISEHLFYNIAKCYAKLKDEERLISAVNELKNKYPNGKSADDLDFLLGVYYYEKNDFPSALSYFNHLYETYPNSPYCSQALFYKMRAGYHLKNHIEVENAFQSLCSIYASDSVLASAHLLYARSLRNVAKKPADAIDVLTQFLERYPQSKFSAEAALELADIYLKDVKEKNNYPAFAKAKERYQFVISNYPQTKYACQAMFMLGYISNRVGDLEDAISICQQLIDTYGNNTELDLVQQLSHAYYTLAFSLYQQGKYDEAIANYRVILEKYPTASIVPETIREIARCYYFKGDYINAIAETQKLINEYPNTEIAREAEQNLATLYRLLELQINQFQSIEPNTAGSGQISLRTGEHNNICGPVALQKILQDYGINIGLSELISLCRVNENGTDMYTLVEVANKLGLPAFGLKFEDNQLVLLGRLPAIAHINGNHYIAVKKIDESGVWYADSSGDELLMSLKKFVKVWTGYTVIFKPQEEKEIIQFALTETEMKKILGGCLVDDCWEWCPNHDNPIVIVDEDIDAYAAAGSAGASGTGLFNAGDIGKKAGSSPIEFAVNLGRGNTFNTFADLSVPILGGMKIELVRTYGSQWAFGSYNNEDNPFGSKWMINYDMHLDFTFLSLGKIYLSNERGNIRLYKYNPDTGYYHSLPLYGEYSIIKPVTGNNWVLERKDGAKYYFNSAGKLTEIKNTNNVSIFLAYDGAGRLSRVTSAQGRGIFLNYNENNNRLISVSDSAGRTVYYSYDTNNNLVAITYPDGYQVFYAYDNYHQITSVRDSFSGNTVLYSYTYSTNVVNGVRPCIKITDSMGNEVEFSDNNEWWNTRTITVKDNAGNILRTAKYYFYSDMWRVAKIEYSDGTFKQFFWDTCANLIRKIDQKGNSIYYYYDTYGNKTAKKDIAGNITQWFYDTTYHLVTCEENAIGKRTYFSYDTNRNLISIINPRGFVTEFRYDVYGQKTAFIDALGRVTQYSYDNVLGMITRIISPDNATTLFFYDSYGNKTTVIDPLGNRTCYEFDIAGRLRKIKDALGNITQLEYYPNGLLKKIIDANGNETNYEYDLRNRLVKETNAAGKYYQYWYDRFDCVTARRDAKDQRIFYFYDNLSRVTCRKYATGESVTFNYDAVSNMTAMRDSIIGPVYWYYDELSRLTCQVYLGNSIHFEYNSIGLKTKVTAPGGNVVEYGYTNNGDVRRVVHFGNLTTYYWYNAVDKVTTVKYPNNVITQYSYDNADRITEMKVSKEDGTQLARYTYEYDRVGNLIRVTDSANNVTNYSYDALHRLVTETRDGQNAYSYSYSYDSASNRIRMIYNNTTTNYTYNNLNQLTQANSLIYYYDDNGNLTAIGSANPHSFYTYDYENKLIEAQTIVPNNGTVKYIYTPLGHKVGRVYSSSTTLYILDEKGRILTEIPNGVPDTIYTLTPAGDVKYIVAMRKLGNGAKDDVDFYYHFDPAGNVVLITDGWGNIADAYVEDFFGNLLVSSGNVPNRYYFATKELEPVTNFYNFNSIWYDPQAGRFIQPVSNPAIFTKRYLYDVRFLEID